MILAVIKITLSLTTHLEGGMLAHAERVWLSHNDSDLTGKTWPRAHDYDILPETKESKTDHES